MALIICLLNKISNLYQVFRGVMSNYVVEFEGVEKAFGYIQALKGISFKIKKGEIFSLIGPNGAGKTTTILTLMGFYKPDKGMVRVFGQDPNKNYENIGPKIGIMLEKHGISDKLTAIEYLDLFAELFGLGHEIKQKRIKELLSLTGLISRANHLIGTYSQGMKQRLCLARCMINQPELLVLDEPFNSIDAEGRRLLIEILSRIVKEMDSSVLLASHDLREVERVSERVAIIKNGEIINIGKIGSLRTDNERDSKVIIRVKPGNKEDLIPKLFPQGNYDIERKELKISISSDDDRNRIIEILIHNRINILSINDDMSNLEQAYFTLLSKEVSSEGKNI